jgi:ribulose-5-phosphate 4-epimerase/fuculose-1-phosphate aldolase
MSATALRRPGRNPDGVEWQARVDLAAAFRLAVVNNWHEAVANHFSVAVSDDGRRFLMNPRWKHFSRIRASDLLLLDADEADTMDRPDAPDPSAWYIHGALHAARPDARCVLHVHPPYGTAMAALADPTILPIDQNTARFYDRVAIDQDFGGVANAAEEGQRIAAALGPHRRAILGNHGLLVVACSVAEAYDDLYYLERACQTMVLAYSTGRPLSVMPPELAEKTARDWEIYPSYAQAHFDESKALLDAQDRSYAE